MTQDVNVVLANMPGSIKGYTIANSDLSYTIVINSRLSFEQQQQTAKHEKDHIEKGDYDEKTSADRLEYYAHELSKYSRLNH